MKESVTIYEKQFSNLNGIQTAQRVEYMILYEQTETETIYGIKISGQEENKEKKVNSIHKISYSKEYVLSLLTFLYENAVTVESAKEVISNLI